MRILISADMEGVTGVTSTADVVVGTDSWQRFRSLFTADVNACVRGLSEAGVTDVLINEAHSAQRNLLLERLDPPARMLTGRHKPLSMMQGVDSGVDGVVFLGYHAGAGSEGVLSHTYLESHLTGVWLDGVHASEGRLNAALAAEHAAPVLLVTGDDRTCADAADYAPDAERVAIKECVSRYAAICEPPERTATAIREAAARAARASPGTPEPARPRAHRVDVEFDATHLAAATAVIPTVEQTGPRSVGFDAPNMTEAIKAFKIVTNIAGQTVEDTYG